MRKTIRQMLGSTLLSGSTSASFYSNVSRFAQFLPALQTSRSSVRRSQRPKLQSVPTSTPQDVHGVRTPRSLHFAALLDRVPQSLCSRSAQSLKDDASINNLPRAQSDIWLYLRLDSFVPKDFLDTQENRRITTTANLTRSIFAYQSPDVFDKVIYLDDDDVPSGTTAGAWEAADWLD